MRLQAEVWDASLTSRSALTAWLPEGLSANPDPTGPTQVDTNFAEIVLEDQNPGSPNDGYTVTFKRKDNGVVSAHPFARFTVTPPASGSGVRVVRVVRETLDETDGSVDKTTFADYAWSNPAGARVWTLTRGDVANGADQPLFKQRVTENDVSGDVEMIRESLDPTTDALLSWERRLLRPMFDTDGDDDLDEFDEPRILEWENGESGSGLKRTWTYYDAADVQAEYAPGAGADLTAYPIYGQPKSYVSETGYWEHYIYDPVSGELEITISRKGDNDYSPTDLVALEANNVVGEVLREDFLDLERAGYGPADVTGRRVTAAGAVLWTGYEVRWGVPFSQVDGSPTSDFTEVWEIECGLEDPTAGGGFKAGSETFLKNLTDDFETNGTFQEGGPGGQTEHRVTRRFRFRGGFEGAYTESERGELGDFYKAGTIYPDGTITIYDRKNGEKFVKRGVPAATVDFYGLFTDRATWENDFDIVEGTITSRYETADDRVLARLTQEVEPGTNLDAPYAVSATVESHRDSFGRSLETATFHGSAAFFAYESAVSSGGDMNDLRTSFRDDQDQPVDPTYSESRTYDCCGVKTRTDRAGVDTLYETDGLGRTYEVTTASNSTAAGAAVSSSTRFDKMGRVEAALRTPDGGGALETETRTYDQAGRVTSVSNGERDTVFFTYRRVKTDGSGDAWTGSNNGDYYWETRVYPHDASSGPVSVVWLDAFGNTVRSWSGSAVGGWTGGEAGVPAVVPSGTESLTEQSRVVTEFDSRNRVVSVREYHTLPTGMNDDGTEGTHYNQLTVDAYDAFGQMLQSEDATGTITASVYDIAGRVTEAWVGTDATGATPGDPSGGASGNNMEQVASSTYRASGELASTRSLKAVDSIADFESASVETQYEEACVVIDGDKKSHVTWTKPQDGLSPWVRQTYDRQGRLTTAESYVNGSTAAGPLLSLTRNFYDDEDGGEIDDADAVVTGRLLGTRVYAVDTAAAGTFDPNTYAITADFVETSFTYDDAGRAVRTDRPEGGYTLTLFDDHGRVAASLLCSDDGGSELDESNDTVVLETVYEYDNADRVISTSTYALEHGATLTGRLEGQATGVRPSHSATWYDRAGRVEAVADYGDDRTP
ncbi:MAG: hypothetical protein AAGE65_15190 [Planctomycetota bacterium]